MVLGYLDVLRDKAPVGPRVAILGAGGIGFDVAEFLTTPDPGAEPDIGEFLATWGVDAEHRHRGGLALAVRHTAPRQVTLLQRKTSKVGAGLGKTTGWIHRAELKNRGVETIAGARYERIDDLGLHFSVNEQSHLLEVDTIVLCTGQEPNRTLYDALVAAGTMPVHLIGGANEAAELDAKRAINRSTCVVPSIDLAQQLRRATRHAARWRPGSR